MESISQSGWSSIRPWIPPLSLSVREITSVSVTFILSAAVSDPKMESELSLAALGISSEDIHGDDDGVDDEDASNSESEAKKLPSVVSSALAGGLSVEVDGSSWRRVFIRIDDKVDEAVIIVYGLMPGRQYEIDLELVQGGQTNSMRRQVTTENSEHNDTSNGLDLDSSNTLAPSSSATDDTAPSTSAGPSTPPNGSGGQSQVPSTGFGFAPLTLEDRLTQLQHTLSLLNSEQVSLTSTIKSSRRDAQKADAALRTEIDVLKRASERYATSEQRAKQKVLALQEAVKRAQIATKDMEATVVKVETELPALKEKRREREAECTKTQEEAEKVRQEKEKEEEKERKRIEAMRSELNTLGKQMEKLEAKKERLQGTVVKDLEEQLESVEKEIEMLEKEEDAFTTAGVTYPHNLSRYTSSTWSTEPGTLSADQDSTRTFATGAISRPVSGAVSNPAPISRNNNSISSNTPPHPTNGWTPTSSPRQAHMHHQTHGTNHNNQRSSSLPLANNHHTHHNHYHSHHHNHSHPHHLRHQNQHSSPTTILTNPHRHSLKANAGIPGGSSPGNGNAVNSIPSTPGMTVDSSESLASSTSSSPSPGVAFAPTPTTTTGSTLSSRARPFEPGRGIIQRSGSRSRTRGG